MSSREWGIFSSSNEIMFGRNHGQAWTAADAAKIASDNFFADDNAQRLTMGLTKSQAMSEIAQKKCELRAARFWVGCGWWADMVAAVEYSIDEDGEIEIFGYDLAEWDMPRDDDSDDSTED